MASKNNKSSQEPELKLMGKTKIEMVLKEEEFTSKPELRTIAIDTTSPKSTD